MATKRVSKVKPTQNERQDYEVLKKFRFLKQWHEVGTILNLKPSQAQYFLLTKKLKSKGAK